MNSHVPDQITRLKDALGPRYTVDCEIGRGGFATVYRARDEQHDREVAVKVLRPELAVSLGAERFLREIQIEARLQHPHILSLIDSGQSGDLLYYTMPFVAGGSLRDKLKRETQLSVDESVRLACEVASALEYASSQGVIHRDIKPENILLSSGTAMVADFGLACAVWDAGPERITESGVAMGTPEYMSPEQAGGDRSDARTDVYSLGCVLFEMLAGNPPFTGATAQVVVRRQMGETVPSLEVTRSSVPRNVTAAVEKALEKVPADRFRSAAEFEAALLDPNFGGKAKVWQNWIKAAVTTVSALVILTILWLVFGPGADVVSLDSNKVVVFPLQERSRLNGTSTGEGVDAAIWTIIALEHTEPLKAIDGWQRLGPHQRADISLLTADSAKNICEDRGARFYVDGTVVRANDSLLVALRLHDVAGDSLVAQESAAGLATETTANQLSLLAMVELLPALLDPNRQIDLTPITDRDPGAIAIWLQGERSYRRSRFNEALGFYRRAVAEDSLLVFAALKGAQAASWSDRADEARSLIDQAVRHDSLLPVRYRLFASGLRHFMIGSADSAVADLRLALEHDSQWSEASMVLAEVYYHHFPRDAVADSSARNAFMDARRFDPEFTPPLYHLAQIALRHDSPGADTLVVAFLDTNPDSSLARQIRVMRDCVIDGPSDELWDRAVQLDADAAVQAARTLSAAGAQLRCAEAGFRAIRRADGIPPNIEWGALLGLQGLLIAEGREAEALSLVDSARAEGNMSTLALYLLNASAGSCGTAMEDRASEVVEFVRSVAGTDYDRITNSNPQTAWLLGIWHSRHGNVQEVQGLHQALQTKAEAGDKRALIFGSALEAHLSLALGDSSEALRLLETLTPEATPLAITWQLGDPLPAERLLRAELLYAKGDYEAAQRVAEMFDHPQPVSYLPYLPTSLELRIRIAEARNRPDLAERYGRRLRSLGG